VWGQDVEPSPPFNVYHALGRMPRFPAYAAVICNGRCTFPLPKCSPPSQHLRNILTH